ncbi:MAG TPA: hypothetical protein VHY22_09830 [Chthoniobacteraceae bacterium]|jgi:hypothetical protein|nr:hypothetical protein [Chthoniobacteraceae bacterium]
MVTFGANDTVSTIEDRLARLRETVDPGDLFLPANIPHFNPGVEAALVQLILTWAAFSADKIVITQIPKGSDSEKSLSAFASSNYYLVALIAANVVQASDRSDISLPARQIVQRELSKNREPFAANSRNRSASLIVSHPSLAPPSYTPYLHLATKGERAPRIEAFERHIKHRLSAFYGVTSTMLRTGRRTSLPSVIYELFENAEEWGCTNIKKEPVKLPLRGVLLSIQKTLPPFQTEPDTVGTFMTAAASDLGCAHFLEVSIFDSGIGLAQRHLKREIADSEPIDEELNAVKECLSKHSSSSDSSSRGIGLHHVMDLASQMDGFLRLRTGRLHLYRNFRSDPYFYQSVWNEERLSQGKLLEGFQFLVDWKTGSRTSITKCAYVKGATFTVILPLSEAQPKLL